MTSGRKILILTAAAACAAVLSVHGALTESSFEAGDFTGWNAQGKGWTVTTKDASAGEKSAMCTVSKGEAAGIKACAKVISKADPGFVVNVSLDVAGKNKSKSSAAKISVICVDKSGSILSEVEKKVTAPSTKFKKVSVPEIIIPSGTAETYLMLMVEVTQPAKSAEWWRFDNVVIKVE